MAVTTDAYTASPPYTASQFADVLRDAMIGAGWMSAWYDSFSDGSRQHRIFEDVVDGSKTYGKTYWWFIFDGADMFIHVCTGWNASTHAPTGTQYTDYISTQLNTTANHLKLATQNSLTTVTARYFKSTNRTTFSCLLIVNGSVSYNMVLDRSAPNSAVDLDKEVYLRLYWARCATSSGNGRINMQHFPPRVKRSHLGAGLAFNPNTDTYGIGTAGSPWEPAGAGAAPLSNVIWGAPGRSDSNSANQAYGNGVLELPIKFTSVNPSYGADKIAVFNSLRLYSYCDATLPTDFIFGPVYNSNTLTIGSTMTINGVTYQIIAAANASNITVAPSMVFAAELP